MWCTFGNLHAARLVHFASPSFPLSLSSSCFSFVCTFFFVFCLVFFPFLRLSDLSCFLSSFFVLSQYLFLLIDCFFFYILFHSLLLLHKFFLRHIWFDCCFSIPSFIIFLHLCFIHFVHMLFFGFSSHFIYFFLFLLHSFILIHLPKNIRIHMLGCP